MGTIVFHENALANAVSLFNQIILIAKISKLGRNIAIVIRIINIIGIDNAGAGQPLLVQTLADILVEKGGTLIYQMKGCQLIREHNNTGAKAPQG